MFASAERRTNFDSIPIELRVGCWAVATLRKLPNDKLDKAPRHPATGVLLSVDDPPNWATFDECRAAVLAGRFPAAGRLFQYGEGLVVFDLDNIAGKDLSRWRTQDSRPATVGLIEEAQRAVYDEISTYTELSQSGLGCHGVVKALLLGGIRAPGVEIYGHARFMLLTGDVLRNLPIASRQDVVDRLVKWLGGLQNSSDSIYVHASVPDSRSPEELIESARIAANGGEFTNLFDGKARGDWSALDASLVERITFLTNDHELAVEVFRRSALWRGDGAAERKRGYEDPTKYEESYVRGRTFRWAWNIKAREQAFASEGQQIVASLLAKYDAIREKESAQHLADAARRASTVKGMNGTKNAAAARATHAGLWPGGLLGRIAAYIYNTAPHPIAEVAVAGAIVFLAGIVGRQYNLKKIGLNQYVVVVAKTGRGKEAAAAGIDRLISAVSKKNPSILDFAGPGYIASGPALLKVMDKSPSVFSIQAEFGHTLKIITDPRASAADIRTRMVLMDLYNKSGQDRVLWWSAYSDTDKNSKSITAPNFNFLGDTTPDRFDRAYGMDLVNEGFLPRLLVLRYDGPRVDTNPLADTPPPAELVEELDRLVAAIMQLCHSNRFVDVDIEQGALDLLNTFDTNVTQSINASHDNSDVEMWNRAYLKASRLAALAAVGDDIHRPVVRVEHVRWALDLVNVATTELHDVVEEGRVGSGERRHMDHVIRVTREFLELTSAQKKGYRIPDNLPAGVIPYAYYHRRFSRLSDFYDDKHGLGASIKSALREAVDVDILEELAIKPSRGRTGKCYTLSEIFPRREL